MTFPRLPDAVGENFCVGFKHNYCPHGFFIPKSWNLIPSNVSMLICEVFMTNEDVGKKYNTYSCDISGFIDTEGAETFSKTFKTFAGEISKHAMVVKWCIDGSYNELHDVIVCSINPSVDRELLNEVIIKTSVVVNCR